MKKIKQLEQLGLVIDNKIEPIKKDIKDIKERLYVIEEDVKKIKNCPTIKKELDELE